MHEVNLVATTLDEDRDLIHRLAVERLLKPDQVRIELIDPLSDPLLPGLPRTGVMPQVQGQNGDRHARSSSPLLYSRLPHPYWARSTRYTPK